MGEGGGKESAAEVMASNNVVVNLTISSGEQLLGGDGGSVAAVTPARRDRVASITIERGHGFELGRSSAVEINIRPDLLNGLGPVTQDPSSSSSASLGGAVC